MSLRTGELTYWTGHGFRFSLLTNVLEEIKQFLDSHPTEFVFIFLHVNWNPIRDIRCCCFTGLCGNMWACAYC